MNDPCSHKCASCQSHRISHRRGLLLCVNCGAESVDGVNWFRPVNDSQREGRDASHP